LPRGSGCGKDISEVSSCIRSEPESLPTVRNISSLVIDDLCDEPCEEDIAIAMFYCYFRDQQKQTTTNIMGAILKQLLVRGEVLEDVQSAF